MSVPTELRARIEADCDAVRPLAKPIVRAISLLPLAALALLAAPTFFNVRSDAERIGWILTWGASLGQVALGFIVITAALRESIPGRAWSTVALAGWIVTPFVVLVAITVTASELSRIPLQRGWWQVGLLCVGGSVATALPIVALAHVLAARAYPTRPAVAGVLFGLGAGLMADAGWRLFCHFGEPSHVLSAHLGGIVVAALCGSALAFTLRTPFR